MSGLKRLRRALLAAGLLLLLTASPAWADELRVYYCFVPDPDTGIVHVSNNQPVGPLEERRLYGSRFLEYLRQAGLVSSPAAKGYCQMAPSAAALDRTRRLMMGESGCNVCGDDPEFRDVEWSIGSAARAGVVVPKVKPIRKQAGEPTRTHKAGTQPATPKKPTQPAGKIRKAHANRDGIFLTVYFVDKPGNPDQGIFLEAHNSRVTMDARLRYSMDNGKLSPVLMVPAGAKLQYRPIGMNAKNVRFEISLVPAEPEPEESLFETVHRMVIMEFRVEDAKPVGRNSVTGVRG